MSSCEEERWWVCFGVGKRVASCEEEQGDSISVLVKELLVASCEEERGLSVFSVFSVVSLPLSRN